MTIAAVAQNINAFRNHLQAEDFHMMENENNDGSIFFLQIKEQIAEQIYA